MAPNLKNPFILSLNPPFLNPNPLVPSSNQPTPQLLNPKPIKLIDVSGELGSSRSSSDTFFDEAKAKECSSPAPLGRKAQTSISDVSGGERKTHLDESKLKKLGSKDSEMEMMKERFSKLLLGEDMSRSGKRVLHSFGNFKCHYQSLCYFIWPTVEIGAIAFRKEIDMLKNVSCE